MDQYFCLCTSVCIFTQYVCLFSPPLQVCPGVAADASQLLVSPGALWVTASVYLCCKNNGSLPKTYALPLRRQPVSRGQVRRTDGQSISLLLSLSHPLLPPFPPSSSSIAAEPLASIRLSSWERCCLYLRARGKPLGAQRSSR